MPQRRGNSPWIKTKDVCTKSCIKRSTYSSIVFWSRSNSTSKAVVCSTLWAILSLCVVSRSMWCPKSTYTSASNNLASLQTRSFSKSFKVRWRSHMLNLMPSGIRKTSLKSSTILRVVPSKMLICLPISLALGRHSRSTTISLMCLPKTGTFARDKRWKIW